MLNKFPHLLFPPAPDAAMALSQDQIRSAAERLDQAEKTRTQIRQLSLAHPGITIEDAYAIQKAWIEM